MARPVAGRTASIVARSSGSPRSESRHNGASSHSSGGPMRGIALGLILLSLLAAPVSTSAHDHPNRPPLVILSAVYDDLNEVLLVSGSDLMKSNGNTPSITFNGMPLTVQTATPAQVVALLPNTFTPGVYLLTVTRGNKVDDSGSFVAALGAIGPDGAAGPQGPEGPAGPQGLEGPIGPQARTTGGARAGRTPWSDGTPGRARGHGLARPRRPSRTCWTDRPARS